LFVSELFPDSLRPPIILCGSINQQCHGNVFDRHAERFENRRLAPTL
jgi:hypothetical protein